MMQQQSPENQAAELIDLRRRLQRLAPYEVLANLWPYHGDVRNVVFPPLQIESGIPSAGKLRVCIVTPDIVGPVKNGGIGTAYRYLAELLAREGHSVTVLYALGRYSESGTIESWVQHYAALGISLVPLPEAEVPPASGVLSKTVAAAYNVHEWLRNQTFDVVHVTEWAGAAYYCLLAKRLQLAFENTLFCVKTSSPTLWSRIGNNQPVTDVSDLITSYLERMSVELADVVVSGSQYMLRWMLEQGYRLPESRCHVQPNIMPVPAKRETPVGARQSVREIVFFGRLEPRKGLHIFCDAITRLARSASEEAGDDLRSIEIVFLGKPSSHFPSEEFIRNQTRAWPFKWRILSQFNQPQALEYLSGEGRLAIMPSLMDNSPFGVYECLAHGIPFMASEIGGIPELIAPEDRGAVLFSLHPLQLKLKLLEALRMGALVARPSFDFSQNVDTWAAWHRMLVDAEKRRRLAPQWMSRADQKPLVSVCIAHYNRPHYLGHALESIRGQDYPNIEVILVDDGSTSPEAVEYLKNLESEFAERNWQIIRQENLYLGAVRNTGAKHAKGKYLLFMDDDNFAKPNEVSRFVEIAEQTDADVLTCFADVFEGNGMPPVDRPAKRRIIPVGANLALGLFRNGFGDSNCLVRRETFQRLGGATEDYRVGKDDQEFFARAVMNGCRLFVVPQALYWYRMNDTRMRQLHYSQHAGDFRVLRAYMQSTPKCLHPVLMLAQGLVNAQPLQQLNGMGRGPGRQSMIDAKYFDVASTLLENYPRLGITIRAIYKFELRCFAAILRFQMATAHGLVRILGKLKRSASRKET